MWQINKIPNEYLIVYKQGVPLISRIVTFDQNYCWMKFREDVYCFIDYLYLRSSVTGMPSLFVCFNHIPLSPVTPVGAQMIRFFRLCVLIGQATTRLNIIAH